MTAVGGPYYEDLPVGRRFADAPAVTLSDGLAAAHAAIVGGRFAMARDRELALRVAGRALAAPALAWDVAIGQSTVVTERGIANLFYRGLLFHRLPAIGDTLKTVTTITGRRPSTPRPDRGPRGLVTMRIVTVDQEGRLVLDFHRCALIPARQALSGGAEGEPEPPDTAITAAAVTPAVAGWNLAPFRAAFAEAGAALEAGATYELAGGDVVSSAPELARLTLNLAAIHHDATGTGARLVYGGHTIGIAAAHISRIFPRTAAILAWDKADHLGPVNEGDTLHSAVTIETATPHGEATLAGLRTRVTATAGRDQPRRDVLDWRLTALIA